MIQAPNGKVYRRNRAHLKPICYDRSSFQDYLVKKEEKQPKNNFFQDHQPPRQNPCLSRRTQATWMSDLCYLMNLTYLKHPHHHPHSFIHPDHHHTHLHHHLRSPSQRTHHPKTGRHQSEPAFIGPRNVDRGLTPGLSALLAETSPLAPYRIERSARAATRQKLNTQK